MEEITPPLKVTVSAPATGISPQIIAISVVTENTLELTCKDTETAQQIFARLTAERNEIIAHRQRKPHKTLRFSIENICYTEPDTLILTCNRIGAAIYDLANNGYISFEFEELLDHSVEFQARLPSPSEPPMEEIRQYCRERWNSHRQEITEFLLSLMKIVVESKMSEFKTFIKRNNIRALQERLNPVLAEFLFRRKLLKTAKSEHQDPLNYAIYRGKTAAVDIIVNNFWHSLTPHNKNLALRYYASCGEKEKAERCLHNGARFFKPAKKRSSEEVSFSHSNLQPL